MASKLKYDNQLVLYFFLLPVPIFNLSEQSKVIHEAIDSKPAAKSITGISERSVERSRLLHSTSPVDMRKKSWSPHPHVSSSELPLLCILTVPEEPVHHVEEGVVVLLR